MHIDTYENFSFMLKVVALKRAGCCLKLAAGLLGGLVRLLREKNSLDVGENSTLGDGDTSKQFVQLFIIPDGKLKVTGDDSGLLIVT